MLHKLWSLPVPSEGDCSDRKIWSGNSNGSSAYSLIQNPPGPSFEDVWHSIWRLETPESIRHFAWQVVHGRLATKEYCVDDPFQVLVVLTAPVLLKLLYPCFVRLLCSSLNMASSSPS